MHVVAQQLEAYNRHDLDAFMACYSPDALIEDGRSGVIASDLASIRSRYARRFADNPDLRSTLLNRIEVGAYVIDDEFLTGFADGSEQHVVLVYRIENDLIASVRFLS